MVHIIANARAIISPAGVNGAVVCSIIVEDIADERNNTDHGGYGTDISRIAQVRPDVHVMTRVMAVIPALMK